LNPQTLKVLEKDEFIFEENKFKN